jgi:hypothetical protein
MKKIISWLAFVMLLVPVAMTFAKKLHVSPVTNCGECGGDHGSDDREKKDNN